VRVPHGSGEDEGGPLARRMEEVGAAATAELGRGRASQQGSVRAQEGSGQEKQKGGVTSGVRSHSAPV
jgi:hypothetical protein